MKIKSFLVTAYLLLIFGIYPFYMEQGYINLGKAKFHFFLVCSLGAAAILVPVGLLYVIRTWYSRYKQGHPYLVNWNRISVTDLFVFMYITAVFLSYVYSPYRKEALWGTEGWYIGAVLWFLLCGFYFLISRFWRQESFVWYVGILAAGAVAFLGILDRFSLYLLQIEVRQSDFISTLGNINWFCGYFSVLMPVGVSLFVLYTDTEGKQNRIKHCFLGVFSLISFMAGFAQGSSSIFLLWGALFLTLLWLAWEKRKWMTAWFFTVSLWGASAQLVRLMRIMLPENYNYATDTLCGYFTDNSITLWIAIISFVCSIWLGRNKYEISRKRAEKMRKLMLGVLMGGVILFAMLFLMHVSGNHTDENRWIDQWSNGREVTWRAGYEAFCSMPFLRKLTGEGPDCFSSYVYSVSDIAIQLREYFGANRLTNAHSEWITSLVNVGLAGTILYAGLFISFILRCLKYGKSHAVIYMPGVCAVCYLVHNMVSFAQVLNLPFIFIVIAMGEALIRQEHSNI